MAALSEQTAMNNQNNGATGADTNPQPQHGAPLVALPAATPTATPKTRKPKRPAAPKVPDVALSVGNIETPPAGGFLWFASQDEADLLRCVVNDFDAATRALPTFDPTAFEHDTPRRLFKAARELWHTGASVTPAALSDWCEAKALSERKAAQNATSDEQTKRHDAEIMLWIEAAAIAAGEITTAPTGATDLAKEVEVIARRLAKVPRFDLATLGELFQRPDPTFIIDRLLTAGGTSLLTAKHKSFKSFFALDMALCIATGRDFHGFKCERGAVIYVAAEGASGLKKRARAWLVHHGIESPPANFRVLEKPLQIADEGQRTAFARKIADLSPALIVLDTLARCGVGLDENNAKDMGEFADALALLATATGAHVMTVHHNNKNGEYRGSSALPAAVDTHLTLERHKETDTATLTVEKQKDYDELHPLSFENFKVTLPNTGGLGHSLVFGLIESGAPSQWRLSQIEQKVLDELAGAFPETGATSGQWKSVCDAAGIKERAFFYAKKKLLKVGAVACPDEQKRGALYTSAPDWCKGA